MTAVLSLNDVISKLESQISFHREREAFHAGQESAHRDQRTVHAAELEKLTRSLETFRSAAGLAVELVSRPGAEPPPSLASLGPDVGRRLTPTYMARRVIEEKPAGEVFGTKTVTAEVNRRYASKLRKPASRRLVSIALRRMLDSGELRSVREGRPHHEALYAKA